jgi:fatty acid desaturase
MSNMTVNQRNQFERIELSTPSTGVHVVNPARVVVTNLVLLAIFGALGYATVEALDSWWRGLVLAVIVLTTIGAMIAVSPNRRA